MPRLPVARSLGHCSLSVPKMPLGAILRTCRRSSRFPGSGRRGTSRFITETSGEKRRSSVPPRRFPCSDAARPVLRVGLPLRRRVARRVWFEAVVSVPALPQVRLGSRPDATGSHAGGATSLAPPAGPQSQGWTRRTRRAGSWWWGHGSTLTPSARRSQAHRTWGVK